MLSSSPLPNLSESQRVPALSQTAVSLASLSTGLPKKVIYDLRNSFSSPGSKTRKNGSGSCRTKLLSCHHGGAAELFFAPTEF